MDRKHLNRWQAQPHIVCHSTDNAVRGKRQKERKSGKRSCRLAFSPSLVAYDAFLSQHLQRSRASATRRLRALLVRAKYERLHVGNLRNPGRLPLQMTSLLGFAPFATITLEATKPSLRNEGLFTGCGSFIAFWSTAYLFVSVNAAIAIIVP